MINKGRETESSYIMLMKTAWKWNPFNPVQNIKKNPSVLSIDNQTQTMWLFGMFC